MIPVSFRQYCRKVPVIMAVPLPVLAKELSLGPAVPADHIGAESGHFLALRRELQQQQADACVCIGTDPVHDLVGRADQSAAQAAVRNAVLLKRDL
jgi:hypothetical protein